MCRIQIIFTFFLLLPLFSAHTSAQEKSDIPLPTYWPTEAWRTDSPSDHGFDETVMAGIDDYIQTEVPYLDSILIIRNGYIVFERYYNDYNVNSLHNIASVTKSWTSALVGIALEAHAIENLDATLSQLLPDYDISQAYPDKSEITARDLLMMRSGIAWNEDAFDTGEYGSPVELLEIEDIIAYALTFPMGYQPGEAWNYSTLDSQLISAIVQEAVGEPLSAYIVPNLFEPMGIVDFDWLNISGVTVGGQQMSLTPRDMAKLGLLYLHNGIWDGKQLIPAEWVMQSLTPQGDALYVPMGENLEIEFYGYHWWVWKPDWFYGYGSFQAKGYAGQQIWVLPDLDLILVTTANLDDVDPETATRQEAGIGEIVLQFIFPALTDAELDYEIHIAR